MNSLLNLVCAASANSKPPIGDMLLYGLIGQVLVFLVLVVLIGIVYLVRLVRLAFIIFSGKGKKKAGKDEKQSEQTSVVEINSDEEIAAVIAAVIAMYTESGTGKTAPFKVKKIYKIK